MAKNTKREVRQHELKKLVQPQHLKKEIIASVNKNQYYWIAALLIFLPFIYSRVTLDPVTTPRYLLLSIFASLFIFVFYILQNKIYIFPLPWLLKLIFITGLCFTIWCIVSLLFSINPTEGVYEIFRQFLNLIILFIIINLISKDEGAILRISSLFIFICIIHSIVGIFQFYEVAFLDLPGANASPYGLMANRNLYASAQLFTLPFIVYVYFYGSKLWKIAASVSVVFFIISIIIAQTRSVWIGALVFLFVFLVLGLIFLNTVRKRILIAAAAFIFIVSVTTFILFNVSKSNVSGGLKERAVSLVNSGTDTSSAAKANINDRITIWKKTAELIREKPILGTGIANWRMNILSYGSKGLTWSNGNYVPDRVHNMLVQTTAETGFPGVIIFSIYWLLIVLAGIVVLKRAATIEVKLVTSLMVAGLSAVAVDCMFSFPMERIEHSFYISLISGFILGMYYINSKQASLQENKKIPSIFIYVALSVVLMNVYLGFSKYKFETNLYKIKGIENAARPLELIDFAEEGKTTFIKLDEVALSIEAKEAMAYRDLKNYPKALELMLIALKLNPNSALVYNNLGTIYTETNDFKTAIKCYEKALKLTPDFDIIKKNLCVNYYGTAQYKKCIALLETMPYQSDTFLSGVMKQSKQMLKQITVPSTITP